MLIAQISDLHIRAGRQRACGIVDTSAALEACVAHLNALTPQPDVVLATGDLAHDGCAEDYGVLSELLQPLAAPLFVIPGNHDDRAGLRASLPQALGPCDGEWIQYTVEDFPVRLVALDTLVPGSAAGALCSGRLAWLMQRLQEQPQRPTVLFMHHPPFRTGIVHMDAMNLLEGAAELGALVARHPRVERLLCGHVHRPVQVRWHGTMASIAPGPAHQIALDFSPESGANFVMEPPACQLHWWSEVQGVVSHMSFIGDHGGPHSFSGP